MIAKICKSSSNVSASLFYNQYKVDKGIAEILTMSNMDLPASELNFYNAHSILKAHQKSNHDIKYPSFHVSLNPDPQECDLLDDTTYIQIAEDYMKSLGYGHQPFVVYKHQDIDRTHIHIVSCRIDHEGKKINDSHEKRRSWAAVQAITKKYNLLPIHHKKQKKGFREQLTEAIQQKESYRITELDYFNHTTNYKVAKLRKLLSFADEHQCTSFIQYRTLLNQFNVDVSQITSKDGKHMGLRFYIKNPLEPNILSFGVKASDLRAGLTLSSLEASFKTNEYTRKKYPKNSYRNFEKVLEWTLNKYETIQLKDLQEELSGQGFDLILHKNPDNRIFGISVYDVFGKKMYKGSEVNLAANKLVSILGETSVPKANQKQLTATINAEYNKLKKSKNIFFESSLIKSSNNYKEELLGAVYRRMPKDMPNLQSSVKLSLENYLDIKKQSIEIIREKEDVYVQNLLQKQLIFCKKYVKEQYISSFLKQSGFISQQEKDNTITISYRPRENERTLQYSLKNMDSFTESIYNTPKLKDSVRLSRTDRDIMNHMDSIENINFPYVDHDISLLTFCTEATRDLIVSKMMLSVVRQEMQKSQDISTLMDHLYRSGIILIRENGVLKLRDSKRGLKIAVPDQLQEKLKSIKVNELVTYQYKTAILNKGAYEATLLMHKYNKTNNDYFLKGALYQLQYLDKDTYNEMCHYLKRHEVIDKEKLNVLFDKGISKAIRIKDNQIKNRNEYFKRRKL